MSGHPDIEMVKKKKIAVIIVEYNTPKRCLDYIEYFKKVCDEDEICFVVVDNYIKADNSIYFSNLDSDITYVRNSENFGFAKANNIGAEIADKKYAPKYYIFSNTDIFLPEKLEISKMISKLESDSKCAVIGPRVTALDGTTLSPSRKAGIVEKHIVSNILWPVNLFFPCIRKFNRSIISNPKEGSCYYVVGAFMIVKSKAFWEAEGFDENTFLYDEEPIFAERLIKKGYTEYYYPGVSIIHEEGGSTYNRNISEFKNFITKRKRVFDSEMYYYENYMGINSKIINAAQMAFGFFLLKFNIYKVIKTVHNRFSK